MRRGEALKSVGILLPLVLTVITGVLPPRLSARSEILPAEVPAFPGRLPPWAARLSAAVDTSKLICGKQLLQFGKSRQSP